MRIIRKGDDDLMAFQALNTLFLALFLGVGVYIAYLIIQALRTYIRKNK